MADRTRTYTVSLNIWDEEVQPENWFRTLPSTGIFCPLTVTRADGQWVVTGGIEDGPTWQGVGASVNAAILDWLAERIGAKADA